MNEKLIELNEFWYLRLDKLHGDQLNWNTFWEKWRREDKFEHSGLGPPSFIFPKMNNPIETKKLGWEWTG